MTRSMEIEARLNEITGEIEKKGDYITTEEITAFETEVAALTEERERIVVAAEQRQKLLESIAEKFSTNRKHIRKLMSAKISLDRRE